jgi:hypothetical protein
LKPKNRVQESDLVSVFVCQIDMQISKRKLDNVGSEISKKVKNALKVQATFLDHKEEAEFDHKANNRGNNYQYLQKHIFLFQLLMISDKQLVNP